MEDEDFIEDEVAEEDERCEGDLPIELIIWLSLLSVS
jgi:hypothetical protein